MNYIYTYSRVVSRILNWGGRREAVGWKMEERAA